MNAILSVYGQTTLEMGGGKGDFRENIELLIFVHHDAKSGPSTARNY